MTDRQRVKDLADVLENCGVRPAQSGILAADILAAGFKREEVTTWEPYFEEVEIPNTGGYTERKQTGWTCSSCKKKQSFVRRPRRYCSECGAKSTGIS